MYNSVLFVFIVVYVYEKVVMTIFYWWSNCESYFNVKSDHFIVASTHWRYINFNWDTGFSSPLPADFNKDLSLTINELPYNSDNSFCSLTKSPSALESYPWTFLLRSAEWFCAFLKKILNPLGLDRLTFI